MAFSLSPDGLIGSDTSIHDNSRVITRSSIEAGWSGRVNGSYYEYDIPCEDLGVSYGGIVELYIWSNPLNAGSSFYYTGAKTTVVLDSGWHGAGYTPSIRLEQADMAASSITVDVVIYNDGTTGVSGEYQTQMNQTQSGGSGSSLFWNSTGIFLRAKWSGWYTSGPAGQQYVTAISYLPHN